MNALVMVFIVLLGMDCVCVVCYWIDWINKHEQEIHLDNYSQFERKNWLQVTLWMIDSTYPTNKHFTKFGSFLEE